jgi:hypothetical protein
MNSENQVPVIRKGQVMSWEDWLKGRRARRETSNRVAPGSIRRESSSSDRRLRKLYNGERGLPFTPTEQLDTGSHPAR